MDIPPTDSAFEEPFGSSSKRKREAPQAPNPYIPFTQEQLEKKFHHLQKTLVAGAKKAQTFETQRLIKKIAQLKKKDDSSSSPEILDLSTQLTELKTVPLAPLTVLTLHTRLTKQHALEQHPILALVVLAPPPPHDELKSKPANRVLSSKTFAKELTDAVKTIRLWMDPEEREKEREKVKEEKRIEKRGPERKVAGPPSAKAGPSTVSVSAASTSTAAAPKPIVERSEEDAGDSRGNADLYFEPGDDDPSDSDDGNNPAGFELDSGDDSDASGASWSSGSVSSSTAAAPPPKKARPTAAEAADAKKKKKKISTSTFLPSLSSGFIAGSDSEAEELSDDDGGRKNRRGQRARKAIWEKKYGASANHLKARTAKFTEATRGRDAFLASRGSSRPDTGYPSNPVPSHAPSISNPYPNRGGRGGRGGGRGGYNGAGVSDRPEYVPGMGPPPSKKPAYVPGAAAAAPKVAKKPAGEEFAGMHPSWVAKQKQKEKEAASLSAKPQGKKVVFD